MIVVDNIELYIIVILLAIGLILMSFGIEFIIFIIKKLNKKWRK